MESENEAFLNANSFMSEYICIIIIFTYERFKRAKNVSNLGNICLQSQKNGMLFYNIKA